jgi:hypothetical protein
MMAKGPLLKAGLMHMLEEQKLKLNKQLETLLQKIPEKAFVLKARDVKKIYGEIPTSENINRLFGTTQPDPNHNSFEWPPPAALFRKAHGQVKNVAADAAGSGNPTLKGFMLENTAYVSFYYLYSDTLWLRHLLLKHLLSFYDIDDWEGVGV